MTPSQCSAIHSLRASARTEAPITLQLNDGKRAALLFIVSAQVSYLYCGFASAMGK